MHTIQVSVRDKIATQTDDTVIINGNSDYNIEFDFDAEWADLNNKIGIFAYNDAAAHKWAYQTVMFSGNTCTVPILRDIHCVYVGVTAGNVRVTTPAKVQCRLSISDYADTEEPPSADIWGQILAKLDELQTEIDAVTATANEAVLYTPQMLDNLQKQQAQKNIGINPEGRTTSMTNPVGVDGYGKLWSKADTSLNVIGATVGQTIKVKAVDTDGKPTAWEAVDMAAGDTEVWEKVCQVTTTENVSFIYQPFGGYYKKIRAIFLGESTAAFTVWIYPNTETQPLGRDVAYIFNAPHANVGKYTIIGEFSSSPYPAPNSADNWYRGHCSVSNLWNPQGLHAGWGDSLFDNYVANTYAKDIAQGVKSLYWTHSAGEIKAGAQMVVYGVKA